MSESKILHIIRGIPGVGKSTLARTLTTPEKHFEADAFFTDADGRYHWRAEDVPLAHTTCQAKADAAMRQGLTPLVVSNTFIAKKHYAPYVSKAQSYGYAVEIHDLFDGGLTDMQLCHRNVHQVPLATISRMRRQYER